MSAPCPFAALDVGREHPWRDPRDPRPLLLSTSTDGAPPAAPAPRELCPQCHAEPTEAMFTGPTLVQRMRTSPQHRCADPVPLSAAPWLLPRELNPRNLGFGAPLPHPERAIRLGRRRRARSSLVPLRCSSFWGLISLHAEINPSCSSLGRLQVPCHGRGNGARRSGCSSTATDAARAPQLSVSIPGGTY